MGLEACALGADVLLTDVEVYTGMLRSEPGFIVMIFIMIYHGL